MIVGLGIGLALQSGLAAFLLGLVGLALGHRFDAAHAVPLDPPPPAAAPRRDALSRPPEVRRPEPPPEPDTSLVAPLCELFLEVARVDGEVTREEIRVVKGYFTSEFRFGARPMQRVRNELKARVAAPGELERSARTCAAALDEESRTLLLDALYSLALADGEVKRSERDALRRAAVALGVSNEVQRRLTVRHLGDGREHFAALGLTPAASDDEIRSAYRRLAAEHHPDRVAHRGEGDQRAATERFRELQDAYEALRTLRAL